MRRRALFVVLALATSGCSGVRDFVAVDKKPATVGVKGYPLDIAYGADPPPAAAEPPAPTFVDVAVDAFDLPTEDSGPGPASPRPRRPVLEEPVEACPPPTQAAAAAKAITADVADAPAPGVYLFQQTGTIDVGVFRLPLPPLTSRVVRNVQRTGTTTDFDVSLFMATRSQVQRYRVVPRDSISLAGIETKVGDEVRRFSPLTPVPVFPLPAIEGEPVNGVGLDPISGETLIVQGQIMGKERVEGCGEVVDGWRVKATWTFQRGLDSQVYDIEYVVATQHGGLMIADRLKTTEQVGSLQAIVDVQSAIGHIEPKPEQAQ